ncbi:MAG: hypothetical protein V8R01_03780 [Bacilli bacterium]|jgi:hypothetical protein
MKTGNKFVKSIVLHIKYPYTALIIATIWISMAIITINQNQNNFETLIIATSICTLIIALIGFKTPK